MKIFLAGGAVRDILLGQEMSDRDYLVTDISQAEFLKQFPNATQVGKTFPIFLLDKVEFSFPRKNNIQDELLSRDLTVNALLLDADGELMCHPQALEDIKNRTLRPASSSSFMEDPLRVFRAARMWAKLPAFTLHPELIQCIGNVIDSGLLASIPADRVGQETTKALKSASPGNFFKLIINYNVYSPWFEELLMFTNEKLSVETIDLNHIYNILNLLPKNVTARWMGLCHAFSELCHKIEPNIQAHNAAQKLGLRLKLPKKLILAGTVAAKWAHCAIHYSDLHPEYKVDMLVELHVSHYLSDFCLMIKQHGGIAFLNTAQRDIKALLSVILPDEMKNQGRESGVLLRQLRTQKLIEISKK